MGDAISALTFSIGGRLQGFTTVDVEEEANGAKASVSASLALDPDEKEISLSGDEAAELYSRVLSAGVRSWDERYRNLAVLDGESWSLAIRFSDGTSLESGGTNAYPETFDDLLRAFQAFGLLEAEDDTLR